MSEDQKKLLESQLWGIANLLRGKISADDYRDYILGFIFYKYLSEKQYLYANELPGVMADMNEARFYPYGGAFAHVVGYVAKVSAEDGFVAVVIGESSVKNPLLAEIAVV